MRIICNMSKDVAECLEGLRKVYSSSPTVSRQFSEDGVELTLGDDGSGSAEEDVAISRRVSIVEESLYEVLKLEENSALEFDEAKLQSVANTMTKAMKLPLSHMPHAFPCKDTYKALPAPPSAWPQRPLMVRPTPSTSTKVIGIVRSFSGLAGCLPVALTVKEEIRNQLSRTTSFCLPSCIVISVASAPSYRNYL